MNYDELKQRIDFKLSNLCVIESHMTSIIKEGWNVLIDTGIIDNTTPREFNKIVYELALEYICQELGVLKTDM